MSDSSRIRCKICGAEVHAIKLHLRDVHPGVSLEKYQADFPGAPILSEMAAAKVREQLEAKGRTEAAAPAAPTPAAGTGYLHEVFGFGAIKPAMNARGGPIPISMGTGEYAEMIPEIDPAYVYDLENLKNLLLGIECNIPCYFWGHAGTGKTTLLEQICARTKRPLLRVQHTVNTEECHIVGQWTARGGETHYELGPLALAMKHGWAYLADEYDFALPSVLSVYQPVLEGKSLVIKDADAANRIIRPHPNFRFLATGNTNGSGDETGLYQGTQLQNAANYDRFGMVLQAKYMKPDMEARIIVGQVGIKEEDARKMVDFANRVREQYDGNKISSPISPRTLINAAAIGARKGSYRAGLTLSFINKLPAVDREVVDGLAQRVFGA